MRHGIEIFANWADVLAPDKTLRTLRDAGATRAIPMVQRALDNPRQVDAVRGFVGFCRGAGIDVTLCTGPAVLVSDAPLDCRDRLVDLCAELHCVPMLDAEPAKVAGVMQHWSPEALAPWLTVHDLQITTTRAQAPRLGAHGRRTYAQLEQQTSTETLEHALRIFSRYSPLERVVPVLGDFDQPGDKRTLAEIAVDLERCTPQARLSGALAMWVAATTSTAEAHVLRDWARETWG